MIHHHVYQVSNFLEHKKKLIDLIYKIPINPLERVKGEKISHQDYNLPKSMTREYARYFENNMCDEYAKEFCNFLNCKRINITGMWFQVYKKGDHHNLHSHPGTNFTNVFYLNLPNKEIKTKIFINNNEQFNIDVKEGDILTFPGYYAHCSPINTFNEDKIVIAFNTDSIF
jgi:hypothetical protein|tara:strand:+ start:53 stop:565 length:513 start_codon:yes stop_codon:yes gene_type:complete